MLSAATGSKGREADRPKISSIYFGMLKKDSSMPELKLTFSIVIFKYSWFAWNTFRV
jgi:hypothetical protein